MVTVVKGSEEHYSFSQSEGFFSLLLVRPFSLKDGRSRKIISIQQFSKLIFFWVSWRHIKDMSKIMGHKWSKFVGFNIYQCRVCCWENVLCEIYRHCV